MDKHHIPTHQFLSMHSLSKMSSKDIELESFDILKSDFDNCILTDFFSVSKGRESKTKQRKLSSFKVSNLK